MLGLIREEKGMTFLPVTFLFSTFNLGRQFVGRDRFQQVFAYIYSSNLGENPLEFVGKIEKLRPLPEPIRLYDVQKSSRSRTEK